MDPATQTTVVGPYPLAQGSTAPRKKKQFFVAPAGLKETNTITRAELAALWACLRHAAEDEA
jgi:hypothetical protein